MPGEAARSVVRCGKVSAYGAPRISGYGFARTGVASVEKLGAGDPAEVGPYEVLGVLGSGGMGRVYLGRGSGGSLVAVKVVHADLARDQEFRKRFRREVAATRAVAGPGVAVVV